MFATDLKDIIQNNKGKGFWCKKSTKKIENQLKMLYTYIYIYIYTL